MHVLTDGEVLVPMGRTDYQTEDFLQRLLASYPNLMPGELVDEQNPRRWLLVTREAGISLPGGGNRWSLDHLFLDQEGIPTLVEVKRASDTRARREVVAQMLDYAASIVAWSSGQTADLFLSRCASDKSDPDAELDALMEPDEDQATFWNRVDANLGSGRIRLIFLADEISPQLQKIIEFLNSQFTRAEVLGIEIRQWTGQGLTTLVSNVIGRTAAAQAAKTNAPTQPRLTEDEFRQELSTKAPSTSPALTELMKWCVENGGFVTYGTGRQWPACYLNWYNASGEHVWPLIPILPKNITVTFDRLSQFAPFNNPAEREEFRLQLNKVPGIALHDGAIDGKKTFPLNVIEDHVALKALQGALTWFIGRLKSAN